MVGVLCWHGDDDLAWSWKIMHDQGKMNAEIYCAIHSKELPETYEILDLNQDEIIFQHDNDPKHTSKLVKNWMEGENLKVLD